MSTSPNTGREKLTDQLESSAQDVGEPGASLSLDSADVAGHPGESLGPVTVHTNAAKAEVALAPDARRASLSSTRTASPSPLLLTGRSSSSRCRPVSSRARPS